MKKESWKNHARQSRLSALYHEKCEKKGTRKNKEGVSARVERNTGREKKRGKSHAGGMYSLALLARLEIRLRVRTSNSRDGYGGEREISYRVNISRNENAGAKSISEGTAC